MRLESQAIDWIFAKMQVRYGALWSAKWADVDETALRADWAEELGGVKREAILYAMGYLPLEFPPNAAQFRAITLRAPEPQRLELPAPKPDPHRVAELLERMAKRQRAMAPKQWAYALQAREKAGERLNERQRAAWRAALKTVPVEHSGWHTPIDSACLPPAMREEAEHADR
jgi:hypothetical protein